MRIRMGSLVLVCGLAVAIGACDMLKKKDDKPDAEPAKPEPTATATASAEPTAKKEEPKEEPVKKKDEPKEDDKTAENEDDIQRYKDEKKIADAPTEKVKQDVDAREQV